MQAPSDSKPKHRRLNVKVDDVVALEAYQARAAGLVPKTVREYADAMAAGAEFPPIKVAVIEGACVLIGGAHRLAAARKLGRVNIAAECYETDHAGAVRMALLDNMVHGEKLSKADLRRALCLYLDADLHRRGRGRVASSRELAVEALGGRVSHATVMTWVSADRPKVAAQMRRERPIEHRRASFDPKAEAERRAVEAALVSIENTAAALRGVRNPAARGAVVEALRKALEQVETQGPYRVTEGAGEDF